MKYGLFKLPIFIMLSAIMPLYSTTCYSGNIDPLNNDSQYAYGENIGWLNFDPSQGDGVTVTDISVTGFIWAENIGWINLGPMEYGGGVINDGSGSLSGWAWGENVGWISFSCKNTGSCGTAEYGVTINPDGKFGGYAWGENIGWINFALVSQPDYRVQTAWENAPTLITLASFTATPKAGQVILTWSTASEINNGGFNIYRAESENGQYAKINEFLITAQGSSTQGTSYEFIDTNVQNRKTCYYKLEDIDLNGTSIMHGPVKATPRWIYGAGK